MDILPINVIAHFLHRVLNADKLVVCVIVIIFAKDVLSQLLNVNALHPLQILQNVLFVVIAILLRNLVLLVIQYVIVVVRFVMVRQNYVIVKINLIVNIMIIVYVRENIWQRLNDFYSMNFDLF